MTSSKHGAKIPINACETLVGEPVFTTKTHCRNMLANQRGMCALQTMDTCSRAPAPRAALGEVADGAAIPQILTSVQWSRPNTELLLKLRRAKVRITWGNNRGTRCPEIVVAVLANPIRSDPIGAIFGERLCKLRTRLRSSDDRHEEFRRQLAVHQE